MRRTELAMGSATFVAVIAAGFLSASFRRSALWRCRGQDPDHRVNVAPHGHHPVHRYRRLRFRASVRIGSWKNWVWANVPMLSPKCPPSQE